MTQSGGRSGRGGACRCCACARFARGHDPVAAFATVEHGIKATGMPAWGRGGMDDATAWDLVAFLGVPPPLQCRQKAPVNSVAVALVGPAAASAPSFRSFRHPCG